MATVCRAVLLRIPTFRHFAPLSYYYSLLVTELQPLSYVEMMNNSTIFARRVVQGAMKNEK